VLYPNRVTALVFAARAESTTSVEASPWDSGAYCKWHGMDDCCQDERARHRATFIGHCLPSPYYRNYLKHYVASCFVSVNQYLEAKTYKFLDPLKFLERNSFTASIFEVRFREKLLISADTLLAVFLRRQAGDDLSITLKQQLDPLRKAGVHVGYYGHSQNVHREVRDWIQGFVKGRNP